MKKKTKNIINISIIVLMVLATILGIILPFIM